MSYRVPKLDGGNKLPAKYLPDTVATDAEVAAAVAGKADAAALAPVATAGTYASLTGKPAIPAVPSDIGAQPAGSYATATALTTGLGAKQDAGSYATTVAGKVPDAQLPDRLQDTQLKAAFVAPDQVKPVLRVGIFPDSGSASSITDFTAAAGEAPTAQLIAYDYSMQPNVTALNAAQAAGRTPFIAWMPNGAAGGIDPVYSLANIIAGNFDAYMTTFLTTIKNLGYPVMIRWAHEMNGDWYSWGSTVNGNTAARYVSAWQRVVNLARTLGVTNVQWVWAPNTNMAGSPPLAPLYPGDAYVDVVAVNGYNWGSNHGSGWRTPSQVFDATFTEIATFTTGKPLWLGETGSDEVGGSKATWMGQFFDWLLTHRIAGFIWFNKQVAENNGSFDWRVNSTPAAAAAFGQGAAKARATTRAKGAPTLAVSDGDNAWRGTQDFTNAKVVGIAAAAAAAVASDLYGNSLWNAGGAETCPRIGSGASAGTQASGVAVFSLFTAPLANTITKLGVAISAGASSGITLARIGLYTVTGGTYTLVARTANTPTLGTTADTAVSLALDATGGFPTSYKFTAGQRYAMAVIHVGTTPPGMYGQYQAQAAALSPLLCVRRFSQTDLPTSMTATDGPHWFQPYVYALP